MTDSIMTVKDSRKYKTIVTDIGKAKIANAVLNGTKVNIITAAVGDGGGSYYVPSAEMTELKNEKWRGTVATAKINTASKNMIDIKIILKGDVGGFTIREIGILDEDDELIALCNTPDVEKVVIEDGIAATLTLVMHVVFTDVDTLEFKIDPSNAADLIEEHNTNPKAHAETISNAISTALQEHTSSNRYYYGTLSLIVPASGWVAAENPNSDYNFICDVSAEGVRSDLSPSGTLALGSGSIANKAGMVSGCETFDGFLRFFSKEIPTEDIQTYITLFGKGGGSGSYYATLLLTVLPSDWVAAEEPNTDYKFMCDVEAEDVKGSLSPVGTLALSSSSAASKAGMVNGCETFDGFVRFFSKEVPSEAIKTRILLFGEGGGGITGGVSHVEAGSGLAYEGGKLNVRIGEGLSFDNKNALSVNSKMVMTNYDLVNETEVLQSVQEIIHTDTLE